MHICIHILYVKLFIYTYMHTKYILYYIYISTLSTREAYVHACACAGICKIS